MSLRRFINERPAVAAIGAAVAVSLCVAIIVLRGRGNTLPPPKQAYYTIDDGKTLFTDDFKLLPPFQHAGKEAVRANVFSCDGGKTTVVAYLQQYTEEYRKAAEGGRPPQRTDIVVNGVLVKRPGDAKWVRMSSPEGARLTTGIQCPAGTSGDIDFVYP